MLNNYYYMITSIFLSFANMFNHSHLIAHSIKHILASCGLAPPPSSPLSISLLCLLAFTLHFFISLQHIHFFLIQRLHIFSAFSLEQPITPVVFFAQLTAIYTSNLNSQATFFRKFSLNLKILPHSSCTSSHQYASNYEISNYYIIIYVFSLLAL